MNCWVCVHIPLNSSAGIHTRVVCVCVCVCLYLCVSLSVSLAVWVGECVQLQVGALLYVILIGVLRDLEVFNAGG